MRYAVYAPTTSGVECNFARAKCILGDHRLAAQETTEANAIKLVIDRNKAEEEEVAGIAREVWAGHFGRA
eukprot:4406519-Alexandrium_andersonii.AAC.1